MEGVMARIEQQLKVSAQAVGILSKSSVSNIKISLILNNKAI
jgi:hypothetical protein